YSDHVSWCRSPIIASRATLCCDPSQLFRGQCHAILGLEWSTVCDGSVDFGAYPTAILLDDCSGKILRRQFLVIEAEQAPAKGCRPDLACLQLPIPQTEADGGACEVHAVLAGAGIFLCCLPAARFDGQLEDRQRLEKQGDQHQNGLELVLLPDG